MRQSAVLYGKLCQIKILQPASDFILVDIIKIFKPTLAHPWRCVSNAAAPYEFPNANVSQNQTPFNKRSPPWVVCTYSIPSPTQPAVVNRRNEKPYAHTISQAESGSQAAKRPLITDMSSVRHTLSLFWRIILYWHRDT